jgi:hypothetical protein
LQDLENSRVGVEGVFVVVELGIALFGGMGKESGDEDADVSILV